MIYWGSCLFTLNLYQLAELADIILDLAVPNVFSASHSYPQLEELSREIQELKVAFSYKN